jgi:hypothetical protein
MRIPSSCQPGPHFQWDALGGRWAGRFIHLPVDRRYLIHKALPVAVLQIEDLLKGPMEVISDIGYLFEQAVDGVAYDPPGPEFSTSKTCSQAGQVTVSVLLSPSLLILR